MIENILKDISEYKVVGNIYSTSLSEKVTKSVVDFYEVAAFPNYNDHQTLQDLIAKVETNDFLKELKKFIGYGKTVIEVGSGTCQLSIFLAAGTNNQLIAFDPTLGSLSLGAKFAEDNNVTNVSFVQGDIFDNPIREKSCDVVFCSGVLHHTKSSEDGFSTISTWCKEDGIIIVGLYNKYGRKFTQMRQLIFKILGGSGFAKRVVSYLDPYLRQQKLSEQKFEAWFRDQYQHPVERTHTIDDVIEWFQKNNINFLGSIPNSNFDMLDEPISEMRGNIGTKARRIISQIFSLFSQFGKEGGLFIVVGQRKEGQ